MERRDIYSWWCRPNLSTVLMLAIAKIAGCKEIVLCTLIMRVILILQFLFGQVLDYKDICTGGHSGYWGNDFWN